MLIVRSSETLSRSVAWNPKPFDLLQPFDVTVRSYWTLNRSVDLNPMRFFGWIANLHTFTMLYCSTFLYCSTMLNMELYLHPIFAV